MTDSDRIDAVHIQGAAPLQDSAEVVQFCCAIWAGIRRGPDFDPDYEHGFAVVLNDQKTPVGFVSWTGDVRCVKFPAFEVLEFARGLKGSFIVDGHSHVGSHVGPSLQDLNAWVPYRTFFRANGLLVLDELVFSNDPNGGVYSHQAEAPWDREA